MIEGLGNVFAEVDRDKELFHSIKAAAKDVDKDLAKLFFNYYMHLFLFNYATEGLKDPRMVEHALYYFIAKEDNMSSQIPVFNNTYQMADMTQEKDLFRTLAGRNSNIMSLTSDAAKVGALLALTHKVYGISKTEMLTRTLFLSQSMV